MAIGFIGLGHMGGMLVEQLVASAPALRPQIVVATRSREKLDRTAQRLRVRAAATNSDLARTSDTIFLCARPTDLPAIFAEIRPATSARHLIVAINNVVTIDTLEQELGARAAKVIPSITHTVGRGVSLIAPGRRCTQSDRQFLLDLMGYISVAQLAEEKDLRMLTNLASSGPAFFAYAAASLCAATAAHGCTLAPDQIERIVIETLGATAQMLAGETCRDLVARVATPGGMTAEGLDVLQQRLPAAWDALISAIDAAEHGKRRDLEARLAPAGPAAGPTSVNCAQ